MTTEPQPKPDALIIAVPKSAMPIPKVPSDTKRCIFCQTPCWVDRQWRRKGLTNTRAVCQDCYAERATLGDTIDTLMHMVEKHPDMIERARSFQRSRGTN